MKALKNLKISERKFVLGLFGLAALITLATFIVIATRHQSSPTKETSNEQIQATKKEPAPQKDSPTPSPDTATSNSPETPQADTKKPAAGQPAPSQQGISGYSPDHIKTAPPSSTISLSGIQVSASRVDQTCVLTMQASVTAGDSNASGEVRFSVTNSQINPAQTNMYPAFVTVPRATTTQVTKSTGPLATWSPTAQLYVSASIVGAQGTVVGTSTGVNAMAVSCP